MIVLNTKMIEFQKRRCGYRKCNEKGGIEMQNLEEAKKWINERLIYIAQNCDLNDKDNKRAYNSLKTALECVETAMKQERKDKRC